MDFFGILFDMKNGKKIPYSKNYFDTLFAAKLEELGVKTITGTLPLSFTAKGGNAVGWTIYGNDNIGANKYGFADDTKVDGNTTFTADGASGTITASGLPDSDSSYIFIVSTDTFAAGAYTFTGDTGSSTTTHYMYVRKQGDSTTIANDYSTGMQEFTLAEPTKLAVYCRLTSKNAETTHIFKPMICKQGETPSTFEPYQVGVGGRTKNLLEINETTATDKGVTFTVDKLSGTITTSGTATNGTAIFKIYIDTSLYGDFLFAGCANGGTSGTYYIDAYDETTRAKCKAWDGTTNSVNSYNTEQRRQMQIPENHICCLRIVFARNVNADGCVFMPMLIDSEVTQDTLIPYGYEIPLTVSQSGQTDKHYDIFVGDSPLTDGETVSKTSTGTDIELFEGSNTVSTTLTNKPDMEIKYK